MPHPTAVDILGPNLFASSPPLVIPILLDIDPIDVIHIPSTFRKAASSVLFRKYDIMYGEKFPEER